MRSSKNKEKILRVLLTGSFCDDCLAKAAGVYPRQAVNSICRKNGRDILRGEDSCPECRGWKLVNRLVSNPAPRLAKPISSEVRPWYWEGNVQHSIVEYLKAQGFPILSAANTESRQAGKDIEAETKEGSNLWVTVKGYPEKSRNTQARHWFSQALLDLILYREEDPIAKLGVGLPDGFTTYRNLSNRIGWFRQSVPFSFYWVSKEGSVRVE